MVIETLNPWQYIKYWKKHPHLGLTAAERRYQLLKLMMRGDENRPMYLNCEGSHQYDNVVRKMVKRKQAKLGRISVTGVRNHRARSQGLKPYKVMRTTLIITAKGKKEFARLQKKYDK